MMAPIFLLLTILLSLPAWGSTPVAPTAPTAVNFNPASSPLSTVTVTSGSVSDLQAKINAATCGTWITVPIATYATAGTQINLPNTASCAGAGLAGVRAISGTSGVKAVLGSSGAKATNASSGDNYIVIQSANVASLPAGTKVALADASNMPTITGNAGQNGVFFCSDNASYYRIIGMNITAGAGSALFLCQGLGITNNKDITKQAQNISIERSLIHGDATNGAANAVQLTGKDLQVVDSRIYDIFSLSSNEDHGVLMPSGTGPYKVCNNSIMADAINVFAGDSIVAIPGVIPSDITVCNNYIYKIASPTWSQGSVPGANSKNAWECKHCQRVNVYGNKFINIWAAAQPNAIQLASMRGAGAIASDINFHDNYLSGFGMGIGITGRPTQNYPDGDGSGGCISSPCEITSFTSSCTGTCTLITLGTPCDCATGDTVEIFNMLTNTGSSHEANGVWVITQINATSFTIPVALTHSWKGQGFHTYVTMYFSGTPLSRVAVTNNYFEDPGHPTYGANGPWPFLQWTVYPKLTRNDGANADDGISTTGSWACSDVLFSHNTITGPSGLGREKNLFNLLLGGTPGQTYSTVEKCPNVYLTNNVMKVSNTAGSANMWVYDDQTHGAAIGTAAVGSAFDSSRSIAFNAMFDPFNASSEYGTLSSPESTSNAIVPDETYIGFTSYTGGTITNFALNNIYTWSNCSASSASAVVTCSGATIPTTVVKGTPFKVDSDGNFGLVLSRDSATQVTLQANYHATISGQSTFGFRGWSSDGADPGINATTLSTAVSGVTP